ncbi:DUF1349 domain-containing protein [Termitidicoccus mucosus]|uniref:DUF1349 domain-containing protein n=1 Tax=Termitidicoccus mucosus TaxID=1184151 RepID=A0A178IMK5_9BACT|nr:hypothetical protein AW736_08100 [Opitutaceae bacterium TSB47]
MKTPIAKLLFGSSIAFALLFATANAAPLKTKAIPYVMEVLNKPVALTVTDELIQISAKGKTNLFNNPNGIYRVQDAPMVVFTPRGDFTLRAKLTGDLKSIYDVCALVIYQDENLWAKFCYENSVEKIPTIVSVVTRTHSDDCNSMSAGGHAYMAMVKKGNEITFLYSPDNVTWQQIRSFHLALTQPPKVGFASHGSRGDGFTAKFTEIKYWDKALDNMKDE